MIRLTIYRPEGLDWAAPCLVYFHGGGFCLRDGDHGIPQYAAPLLARDFSNLPPAYVEAEEFDCFHDEGIAYAKALDEAGVEVQVENVRGTFHGFDFFNGKEISKTMVQKRPQTLRRAFQQS